VDTVYLTWAQIRQTWVAVPLCYTDCVLNRRCDGCVCELHVALLYSNACNAMLKWDNAMQEREREYCCDDLKIDVENRDFFHNRPRSKSQSLLSHRYALYLQQLLDVAGLTDFTVFVVIVVLTYVGKSCRPTAFCTINKTRKPCCRRKPHDVTDILFGFLCNEVIAYPFHFL